MSRSIHYGNVHIAASVRCWYYPVEPPHISQIHFAIWCSFLYIKRTFHFSSATNLSLVCFCEQCTVLVMWINKRLDFSTPSCSEYLGVCRSLCSVSVPLLLLNFYNVRHLHEEQYRLWTAMDLPFLPTVEHVVGPVKWDYLVFL